MTVFRRAGGVLVFAVMALSVLLLSSSILEAQKIAVLAPEKNDSAESVTRLLLAGLSQEFTPVDSMMSDSIFKSFSFSAPYNLSTVESRNFGASIGSNFFILVRAHTFRRTSFEKDEYYESYAAYFLVSSRTGKLLDWRYSKFEEDTPEGSRKKLFGSVAATARDIGIRLKNAGQIETSIEGTGSGAEDLAPPETRPGLRAPMPFLRLKPVYTSVAGLYDVLATIDAMVEIDRAGNVGNIEIVRWAGFGLEESVIEAVRQMKWRPADYNGKPLAMRILLRYNFKNIESED